MDVAILTPVRLLGESLSACLNGAGDVQIVAVASDWLALESCLADSHIGLVIVDVTQGIDLKEMRGFVAKWPMQLFLALGLREQRQEVVNCGRAGFVGYVARDASIDKLRRAIADASAGRLTCPDEIAGELLRALYRVDFSQREGDDAAPSLSADELTRRESEVARFIANGCSNKEIARHLSVSVATVKHHVHNILTKMQLPTRVRVARALRASPWMGV